MPKLLDSWVDTTLGELCDPETGLQTGPFGSQLHASDYTEMGIPVIMPKDIVNSRVSTEDIARIPEEIAQSLSRHRLTAGDIVFGRRGDIGRCALITGGEVGWLCGTGCLRARLNPENIVPEYAILYLQTPEAVGWLETNAVGQTMLNLNTSILAELPIRLPPLAEQRKIAAILSTWDEAITLTGQLIAALQRRKQVLIQLLLTGKKTLPDNWRWGNLSEFLVQNRDYVTELEDKLYPRISVKWWAKGAVVDGFDNGLEVKMNRHQLAKGGQIIVSEIWAKHGSMGIIPSDGEGALITSHFFLFDFISELNADPKYIKELVTANYFMGQADKLSKGSTGYASLRAADFLRFSVPVPPLSEQTLIADVLETCDDLLELHESYRSQLQTQKRGLMQELLTGAVRVNVIPKRVHSATHKSWHRSQIAARRVTFTNPGMAATPYSKKQRLTDETRLRKRKRSIS